MIANLAPHLRYKIGNMITLSMIPGPNQPKNLVSFLDPFLEEMKDLGVNGRMASFPDGSSRLVRVFVVNWLADLPAVAKLALLRGHRAFSPCRFCTAKGIYVNSMYHTPSIPGDIETGFQVLYEPNNLDLCSHQQVMGQFAEIEDLEMNGKIGEAHEKAKQNGFASLHPSPLLLLPRADEFGGFPPDIMHLLYANASKFMISLWFSTHSQFSSISCLTDSAKLSMVEANIEMASKGFPISHGRKPRPLSVRGL